MSTWYMETPNSSLIEDVEYDDESLELTVKCRYGATYIHVGVRKSFFDTLSEVKSAGNYYSTIIKQKFKLKTMPEKKTRKELGVNNCSDKKRFIKMRITVNKFNRAWFFEGEKDTYADITLQLLPNGTTDKYGNLGMITQDVPKAIVEAEKDLPNDQKSNGEIVGNGFEFRPKGVPESAPGSGAGELKGEDNDAADELPF